VEDAFDRKKFLLKTITLEEDSHEYGIYIFPYYLSTKYNDKKIGDIWKVKSGDGKNQMGGNASWVLKNDEGERTELDTKWNLKFSKHKKREK
jgi:hypothetical protein